MFTQKKQIIQILIIFFTTFILFGIGMELWQTNWNIPFFYYGSDDFGGPVVAKRAISGQLNYWVDNRLAAPYTQELYQFPMWSPFYYAFCLFMGLFTDNFVYAVNLYYFCTYLLSVYTTVYLLKKLKIRFAYALLGGIVFSFCQYHFFRGMNHLTATSLFVIPIFSLLIFNVISGEYSSQFSNRGNRIYHFLCWLGLCFLSGTVDLFYSLFGCWLMLIAGIYCFINGKRKNFVFAMFSIGIVSLTLLINLYAPLIHAMATGNLGLPSRSPYDAYFWGLQIVSLFMPQRTTYHPLSFITNAYSQVTKLPQGENVINYLGIIAIIGFIITMLALIKNEKNSDKLFFKIKPWGVMNLFALLLGVVGGGGLLIALTMSPILRTYTRIFPYILLFCVISSMLCIEYLSIKKNWNNRFCTFIAVALIILHTFDCNIFAIKPHYNYAQYEIDKSFIQSIEAKFSENAKILQFPYVKYPENPLGSGNNNTHLKGYIHSSILKWSYGALPNTPSDLIQQELSDINIDDMTRIAWKLGFEGIYVDTSLYEMQNKSTVTAIQELSELVDDNPLISTDGKMYFFDMRKNKFQQRDNLRPAGIIMFGDGFSFKETNKGNTSIWRWSNQRGKLSTYCVGNNVMEFELTGASGTVIISINGKIYNEYSIDGGKTHKVLLPLQEGVSEIIFESTGKRVDAPRDHRSLYFRLINYRITQ